jgi:glycosyltransferase involved in cell wall biosynthesis
VSRLISIVVPLHDEEASVVPLVLAVEGALQPWHEDWELILVDDGSRDATFRVAVGMVRDHPRLRLLKLARRYGQSTALQAGFDHARGEVVVTMDGDLQSDPADIPAMVTKLDDGFELVTGYRGQRRDPLLTRRLPSRAANWLLARWTGVLVRDSGCPLKAYRRRLLDRMRLYSDLHRFVPALAVLLAGARVAEVPVRHHERLHGRSKYGLARVGRVLSDLLMLKLIGSFRERPLALFGIGAYVSLALLLAPLGLFFAVVAGAASGSLIVLAGISLCLIGLTGFLLMLGVLAESVVHSDRPNFPSRGAQSRALR